MCFFHHDHQWTWFNFAFTAVKIFGGSLPGITDLAGDQVGDQQVVKFAIVLSKRKHHMAFILQGGDDRLQPVAGRRVDQVRAVEKPTEFATQCLRCTWVNACLASPEGNAIGCGFHFAIFILNHSSYIHFHEFVEPVLMKIVFQLVKGGGTGLFEVKDLGELQDVFSRDIAVTDLKVKVRGHISKFCARPQPNQPYFVGELAF